MKYGPYVHGLNKGGLEDILATSKLRATEARYNAGGGAAVRAHEGAFSVLQQKLRWHASPERIFIEFHAEFPPDKGCAPGLPRWTMEEGEYLPIRIIGVYRGCGEIIR